MAPVDELQELPVATVQAAVLGVPLSPEDGFADLGSGTGKVPLQLFLSKDHGAARDIQSSVIVSDDTPGGSLTQSGCLDQYVKVTGTFNRLEGVAWHIKRVQKIRKADTGHMCWKRE